MTSYDNFDKEKALSEMKRGKYMLSYVSTAGEETDFIDAAEADTVGNDPRLYQLVK